MKIDIRNILEAYLRDKRSDIACPACTVMEGEYAPLVDITGFLARHKLSLNAQNIELAWEYVCGDNKLFKAELDRASPAFKINNQSAFEIHEKYFRADLGARIEEIFRQAVEQIRNTSKMIDTGNENAIRHESELIEQADNIRGGKGSLDNAVQKMLNLTRLMVESTRENQKQILHSNEKLAELQNELDTARKDAVHDKLTGLPNRRKFDRDLDSLYKQLQDGGKSFVLAFVDVDHFKRINDTFGHDCGDRVLRMIANHLSLLANKDCHLSRYGGEEFALLFEHDDIDRVFRKVDNCRASLALKSLVDVGSGQSLGRITFSVGMALCLQSDDKQTILRKADNALYKAKSEGRNMVIRYSNRFEKRTISDS